jgi:N-sulfoglucosamine sulfohydrolase
MIKQLEDAGELEDTLIIVTADNGMPFPRAKANAYEYGIHVPLAIRWGARVPKGRTVDDVVGFVDLTATILEATGTKNDSREFPPSGRSIMDILTSNRQGKVDATRTAVYSARERHSSSRYDNWTYPQRAVRTERYLYIRNFRPDRWPAGDPVVLGTNGAPEGPHSGYKDIDGSPTLKFMIAKDDDPKFGKFLQFAVAKRPAEELFDIQLDPACLKNLATDPEHRAAKDALARQLETYLRDTRDPRVLDGGEVWETYRRFSGVRSFPKP